MIAVIIVFLLLIVFLLPGKYSPLTKIRGEMQGDPETEVPQEEVPVDVDVDTVVDDSTETDGFINNKSGGSHSWDPATNSFVNSSISENSYVDGLIGSMGTDVTASHESFVEELDVATMGPSAATERDDFMPAVPFHGLPRKAHYAHLGADRTSRVSTSESSKSLAETQHHNSTGYVL